MSHEIRTPLNGIMGMSQFLQMSLVGKEKEMADNFVLKQVQDNRQIIYLLS